MANQLDDCAVKFYILVILTMLISFMISGSHTAFLYQVCEKCKKLHFQIFILKQFETNIKYKKLKFTSEKMYSCIFRGSSITQPAVFLPFSIILNGIRFNRNKSSIQTEQSLAKLQHQAIDYHPDNRSYVSVWSSWCNLHQHLQCPFSIS